LAKKGETNEEIAIGCADSSDADDSQHGAVVGRLLLASLASLASLLLLLLQWYQVPRHYPER